MVHRDALGWRRSDRSHGFANPADRELCAGAWRVTALGMNGESCTVTITIPLVDPADGARAA